MLPPKSHPPSRRPRALVAIAIGAFALTASGLVLGLRAVDTTSAQSGAAEAPAAAAAPAAGHGDHGAADARPAASAAAAEIKAPKNTMSADAPAYRPAKVHTVHFDMTEKTVEIAPGKVVKVWTFGDQVPGPVVRVRVGDTVKASITNKMPTPHSIDFHAARIAPERSFRDVGPG